MKFIGSHVPEKQSFRPWLTQRRLLQHALGLLYADQGKLVEAEQMFQRALQSFEKAWVLEHTSTLDTVNNLGIIYANQGKLDEAEQMYQRALQGKEKAWGPEHMSTLSTFNNLGILYAKQSRLAKAECYGCAYAHTGAIIGSWRIVGVQVPTVMLLTMGQVTL
jgi:tetratricopeptide (TPR) repeat protein